MKEIRGLSVASADRLLKGLDMSVSDLMWRISMEHDAAVRAIPVLRNRIGPGSNTSFSEMQGHIPLAESLIKDLINPVAARLCPDLVLPKSLAANDLVLLDQNPIVRRAPETEGLWVVHESGGMRVRYLRMDGERLYVPNELTLEDPRKWHSISLAGLNLLDIVKARIVWFSREIEKPVW
jgi:hypothetical protein